MTSCDTAREFSGAIPLLALAFQMRLFVANQRQTNYFPTLCQCPRPCKARNGLFVSSPCSDWLAVLLTSVGNNRVLAMASLPLVADEGQLLV